MRAVSNSCYRGCLLLVLLGTLLACEQASAKQTYVYQEQGGGVWYTDHAPIESYEGQYTLIATYGRPTASASCRGVTAKTIEARARFYQDAILREARRHRVSPHLVRAIIAVESCFDRHAVSRVGAKGLMQLMDGTAKDLNVTNVFNHHQNIAAGTRYFSRMKTSFNHDISLALAAYNAGPGAVRKHKGIPPYKETQNYVKRVLRLYRKYLEESS